MKKAKFIWYSQKGKLISPRDGDADKILKGNILNYQIRYDYIVSHFIISERLLKPPKSGPENLIEIKIGKKRALCWCSSLSVRAKLSLLSHHFHSNKNLLGICICHSMNPSTIPHQFNQFTMMSHSRWLNSKL